MDRDRYRHTDFGPQRLTVDPRRTARRRTIRHEPEERRRRPHRHRIAQLIRAGLRAAGHLEYLALVAERPDHVAFEVCWYRDGEHAALALATIASRRPGRSS